MATNIFAQNLISESQAAKATTANENFASLKNGIRGLLSKSVAGGANVTLTQIEAENAILEFSGILTANIQVIVPTFSKIYSIRNLTTGGSPTAFTLTVKTTAGTGIAVGQGIRTILYCDGTNVVNLSATSINGLSIHTTAPTDGQTLVYVAANGRIEWATVSGGGGGGAPTSATYVVSASDATLTNEIIIPSMAGHPDAKPATAQTEDDDFDAGSLEAKWTWQNQGSASATLSASHLRMHAPAASGINIKAITQPVSGTWTFAAKASLIPQRFTDGPNGGIVMIESGTSKVCAFSLIHITSTFRLAVYTYPSLTGAATQRFIFNMPSMAAYLKVQNDGTNFQFSYSFDGRNYSTPVQMAVSLAFTTAPDQIGLQVSSESASYASSLSVDWFRRLA